MYIYIYTHRITHTRLFNMNIMPRTHTYTLQAYMQERCYVALRIYIYIYTHIEHTSHIPKCTYKLKCMHMYILCTPVRGREVLCCCPCVYIYAYINI